MKELNIPRLELKIEEAGTLEDRSREAHRVHPQIEAEEALRHGEVNAIVHEYSDAYERRNGGPPLKGMPPTTIRGERSIALMCTLGAIAAVAVDSGLSTVLGRSWLALGGSGAVVVGTGIAIALSFAAKGGIAKLVVKDERPKTTRRRIWTLTLVSLVSTLILAWIVLASRNPSEGLVDFLLQYVGMTLAALSLSLAFFAGTLFVAASEYNWSRRMEAHFQTVTLRIGELTGFKTWVSSFIERK